MVSSLFRAKLEKSERYNLRCIRVQCFVWVSYACPDDALFGPKCRHDWRLGLRSGDSHMKLAFQLIACWLVVSCVVGPLFSWAFFWGERLARDETEPVDSAASLGLVDAQAR